MSSEEISERFLPSGERTLLLRACIGASSGDAWQRWTALVGDPSHALSAGGPATRALGPMLDRSLRAAGVAPPEQLRVALRAAATRERERTTTMRSGIAGALEALGAAGISATLIGDVALAETAYPEPGLRHCHGLELLVERDGRQRARGALAERGGGVSLVWPRGGEEVPHPLGAPVAMFDRLLSIAGPRLPLGAIVGRCKSIEIDGAEVSVLAADDLLLRTIARALCDTRSGELAWPLDAQQLIARAGGSLDWERLAATARGAGLQGVLAIGLRYVGAELGAAVPADLALALERSATTTSMDLVRVAALRRMRWDGGWVGAALRPRNAIALLRWSPAYLRQKAGELR